MNDKRIILTDYGIMKGIKPIETTQVPLWIVFSYLGLCGKSLVITELNFISSNNTRAEEKQNRMKFKN